MNLEEFFKENSRVALGFSGGVDSSYLLYAALKYGANVHAYYIKTCFQPQFEYDDAMRMAKLLGANVTVLNLDALADENVVKNPKNRCYYCKISLFTALKKAALADGFTVLLDGTNASDDADDRPGMKALQELKVLSPLRECGLTKSKIRELSKAAGLFTWDKPAYACLATRIPTNTPLDAETLLKVERSEQALMDMGFSDFRVRVFNKAARIQLLPEQLINAAERATEIRHALEPYFDVILFDTMCR
ncbi:MAG: ATP-dependent sacrificial sulfur transferase LarE [Clostridia bacterium]|jgi:pyridinium-3,5-biscarboxylic acid mononucleotide sulfurtransferase|nr:ATP-dependent sacrificial sulfur transferase LarE [Clostridia bacterium]NLS86192.1 ATP-dependent sacrificial sulfur transferase LarE [Oscillospiraceae bacterium]